MSTQSKLLEWLPFRADFLDELLRFEGCEEYIEDGNVLCSICTENFTTVRCRDCARRPLCCESCLRTRHADMPLHRIEKWDGAKFLQCSLRDIGLIVQLGHDRGTCAHPAEQPRRIIVGHTSGVQAVSVRFCECLDDNCHFMPEWCQLFRFGWFPASTHSPATTFTFDLLNTFQELSFQGKTNLFDFWRTIEHITDNSGGHDVFDCYKQLSHTMRIWHHLVMLKRFGRAHDPAGPDAMKPGELVVECPACPHPGRNILPDWEAAPPDVKSVSYFKPSTNITNDVLLDGYTPCSL
ncbi:hypothetical protein BD309DRAFT_878262 [Dichomitus squalens]|uniref:Uncharacterized protein n=1 Tax=Dichomitus squalens TaxID=114155 RepID=A0A4Q9PFN8_9APHY|nr:hypothetical protein BD309DRAFT_878262 [Dichomitus squalens]TBU51126.1 hypothetical protein BD310DRAFT_835295 [Dichomitus squalens]